MCPHERGAEVAGALAVDAGGVPRRVIGRGTPLDQNVDMLDSADDFFGSVIGP
jgi:hypothetical protein